MSDPRTLEEARNEMMVMVRRLRSAQTMKQRQTAQMELDELYTLWPGLRGGSDEVKVRGR